MTPMTDVAGYIYTEMMKNIDHTATKKIRELYDIDLVNVMLPPTQVMDVKEALDIWKSMVGNSRLWDHKAMIKQSYGNWSHDSVTRRKFNFDIWSNLHYGYVGASAGMTDWILKSGAGYAQWRAGTDPPGYWSRRGETIGDADFLAAFDDPMDQEAIVLGTALWDMNARNLTLTQLITAVRAEAADLNTQ